jgi:hypothetical protein
MLIERSDNTTEDEADFRVGQPCPPSGPSLSSGDMASPLCALGALH